ncbi:MAG: NRDE family protein [Rhodothermaceae bacterium]|nr:NRDE family protein [Rhodothermaceae bacterium]
MCVLFFALDQHPRYRLVFAANRDEAYARPTAPSAWWDECPGVLAGRDLNAGGTWMGVTRTGRWTALTNVRDVQAHHEGAQSRGDLTRAFLCGGEAAEQYAARVFAERARYNPFNLLVGDGEAVWTVSSHTEAPERLAPGVYGLSNATLQVPWPKVTRGLAAFEQALAVEKPEPEAFFEFLRDETRAPDEVLPETGVGRAWERVLSPLFITSADYGTRASMVLLLDAEGSGAFVERTFAPGTLAATTRTFDF